MSEASYPELRDEHPLDGLNTLGLSARAAHFMRLTREADLAPALALAAQRGWPVSLLGGGSNLILAPYQDGLVLQPGFSDCELTPRADGSVGVRVAAGHDWHALVMAMAVRGLWGLENLALIPGQCGAAPIQNIGAYGVELAEVLEAVELRHLDDGRAETLGVEECAFGYRDSLFKGELAGRVMITHLRLRLSTRSRPRLDYGDLGQRVGKAPTPRDVAEAVCAIRREKLPDPGKLANAGSFFKNPLVSAAQAEALIDDHPAIPHFAQPDGRVKLAAGWLIDQCGLKGWREGPFGVHERQALVLVHHGGGDARGLLAFAERVAERVRSRFGVELEREPRLMGRFD
ncbi:UDP-N-acetylmuramate dehydrogenase [Halomonas pacifica]|uniref:UDP-N-acetylmuramate dehydrogenase n=1 Tax=Bisbaumannia pacifica TaxID=77098 RepID=UPI0023591574|nr:UDP-N-acetylmuramate dehydrogenase [Halomonas pacifica]MDC8804277.1 UDP-N-acetylmuramate dehydrogenase [Halomonas pacifica]